MAERQASVSAQDLKTSSDFLMKSGPLFDSLRFSLAFCSLLRMESSGHSPSSELLDKALSLIFFGLFTRPDLGPLLESKAQRGEETQGAVSVFGC